MANAPMTYCEYADGPVLPDLTRSDGGGCRGRARDVPRDLGVGGTFDCGAGQAGGSGRSSGGDLGASRLGRRSRVLRRLDDPGVRRCGRASSARRSELSREPLGHAKSQSHRDGRGRQAPDHPTVAPVRETSAPAPGLGQRHHYGDRNGPRSSPSRGRSRGRNGKLLTRSDSPLLLRLDVAGPLCFDARAAFAVPPERSRQGRCSARSAPSARSMDPVLARRPGALPGALTALRGALRALGLPSRAPPGEPGFS